MTDRSRRNLAAISPNRSATQPRNALAETTLKLCLPAILGPVAALLPGLDDPHLLLLWWWRRHLLGIALHRHRWLSWLLLLQHLQLSLLHFLQ